MSTNNVDPDVQPEAKDEKKKTRTRKPTRRKQTRGQGKANGKTNTRKNTKASKEAPKEEKPIKPMQEAIVENLPEKPEAPQTEKHPDNPKRKVVHQTIRIKVGENVRRPTFIPMLGEPIYTWDDKRFWIGDGKTPGGLPVTVSQFFVEKVEDIYELDDAEVGDFAIIHGERLFFYMGPKYSYPGSWFEIPVATPPRKGEQYWVDEMLNQIRTLITEYQIDKAIQSDDMMDDDYQSGIVSDIEYEQLILDRKMLMQYSKKLDHKRPRLEYQSYK